MLASDHHSWVVNACKAAGGLLLALLVQSGHAQSPAAPNRDQEQLRRVRQQMQQLQQEQADLQAAQAQANQGRVQAEAALKDTESALQTHKQSASKASRQVGALSKEVSTLKSERDQLTQQVQQLTAQLQTTTTQLDQHKTQLSQTQGSLQQSQGQAKQLTSGLDQCRGDNAQLYQLSTDLLTRYENKGWREVVGAKEPFFQYARVRLENTKAQYQDKIEAARHTSSNTPTQPAP